MPQNLESEGFYFTNLRLLMLSILINLYYIVHYYINKPPTDNSEHLSSGLKALSSVNLTEIVYVTFLLCNLRHAVEQTVDESLWLSHVDKG